MAENKMVVDELKVKRMLFEIMRVEKENVRKQENSDSQMVSKIEKIIKEEVQCL